MGALMKIAFIMTLGLATSFCFAENSSTQVVKIGYFIMKPYMYADENVRPPVGIVPQFLNKHIAPKMNVKFRFYQMPLARILVEMENGNIDGIAIIGYDPKRAEIFDYPANHMQKVAPVFAFLNSRSLNVEDLFKDNNSLRIGHVKDSIITPSVKSITRNFDVMYGHNVWKRSIEKLLLGRIDALYAPFEIPLNAMLNQLDVEESVNVMIIERDAFHLFTMFSAHPEVRRKKLLVRYDKAFEQAGGLDTFRQIYNEYEKILPIKKQPFLSHKNSNYHLKFSKHKH